MIQNEVINHIYAITGININTKSRKREIVELKCVYATILRNYKHQKFTLQEIGDSININHASIINLLKVYPYIKTKYLNEIEQKVIMLLKGMTLDIVELQIANQKMNLEIEEIKKSKENEIEVSEFFKNLIKLANENEDVMFKLETFYKINSKIYEQRNL